jgi:hypothetical protein
MIAGLLAEFLRRNDMLTPRQWEILGYVALIFLIPIILGSVYNHFHYRRQRSATECLTREALKWHGTMDADRLAFDHNGTEIAVSWGVPHYGLDYVYASFQKNPFPGFSFRIISNKRRSVNEMLVRTFSGGIEILEGFWVRSNNEALLRLLLTPEIEQNLQSYRPRLEIVFGDTRVPPAYSGLGVAALDFEYEPGRLYISMFKLSKDDADYDALIQTTLMFYEELDRVAHSAPLQ